MVPSTATQALQDLQQLEQQAGGDLKSQLAIIRISEPISSLAIANQSPSKRGSDVSALDTPTPASLEADLVHYKDLFSKLRFSYLEQVTKEKFLRAIVGDPPLVVGHNENVELETQLAEAKAELQARKEDVRVIIEEMEKTARELAKRYEAVQLQMTQLSTLPDTISELKSNIASLRARQSASNERGSDTNTVSSSPQHLPLPATLSLLAERETELSALNRQLAMAQSTLPRKTREAETIEREVGVLRRRKSEAESQAREAKRRKEQGESDGLEEAGRWYRGAEAVLKRLVDVEG